VNASITRYLPAAFLTAGAAMTLAIGTPHPTPLVRPLGTTMPRTFMGHPATPLPIGADERRSSGVTDYLNQAYFLNDTTPVQLYVGYHATQQGDNRMHSPSLCLPGSGWTPIASSLVSVPLAAGGSATVNRFVLQKGGLRILTYYWFQGRGRITAGQAQLKFDALRDSFLYHRDEDALVRIIVPLPQGASSRPLAETQLTPDGIAARLAAKVVPELQRSLPPAP